MKNAIGIIGLAFLASCSGSDNLSDGYGSFEAQECVLSAEMPGKIVYFDAGEGDKLDSGKTILIIDTNSIYLKKKQIHAQKKTISSKVSGILAQIAVLQKQKEQVESEIKRMEKLVASQSIPTKQLDDLKNQNEILKKQIESVRTQNEPVLYELESLDYQIKQLDDQISKSVIKAPFTSTLVEKYSENHEYVSPGKSVVKLSDINTLYLRAYIDGSQLSQVKLGDEVSVLFDDKNSWGETKGIVSWISDEAEFTPKTIQTREERTHLVYALKIKVSNDGRLKIGMPGEFKISK